MRRLLFPLLVAFLAVSRAGAQSPSWETLRAAYDYDAKRPLALAESPAEGNRLRLRFTNLRGETVPGILLKPAGKGPFPCVLLLHGLGGNKEQLLNLMGPELTRQGIACFALDAALHGERKKEGESAASPANFVKVVPDTVLDYRQALDGLSQRSDILPQRIGLAGYSMGAIMGSVLAGVDSRVQAATLCVGGDPIKPALALVPEALRSLGERAAPSNFLGHAAPRPVYLINGTKDTTITPEAAKRLIAAAKPPFVSVWVESGHLLPAADIRKGLTWLARRLTLPPHADRLADPGAPENPRLSTVADPDFRVEKLTFTNAAKETVGGLFVRPKTGEGPFPLVLVLHGRGHSKERMLNTMKREFAERGVAALALDAAGHGERTGMPEPEALFTTTIRDWRQALHWALERPEVDAKRVGLIGFSMGAMMGTTLAALDLRVQASLLCVGGELETLPESVRPAAFAPYLDARPIAFINGHKDPVVPEAAALKLHAAAPETKTVFWYDEPDHTLPKPVLRQGTDWLLKQLGQQPLQ